MINFDGYMSQWEGQSLSSKALILSIERLMSQTLANTSMCMCELW